MCVKGPTSSVELELFSGGSFEFRLCAGSGEKERHVLPKTDDRSPYRIIGSPSTPRRKVDDSAWTTETAKSVPNIFTFQNEYFSSRKTRALREFREHGRSLFNSWKSKAFREFGKFTWKANESWVMFLDSYSEKLNCHVSRGKYTCISMQIAGGKVVKESYPFLETQAEDFGTNP